MSIAAPLHALTLWRTLVRQDLAVRYRGTLLGRLWPLLLPAIMLAVYGFVFGAVFKARWPGLAEGDKLGFALNLFAGLLVHAMLVETVGQAPTALLRNANFVRKLVFPLPVLVGVPLGGALVTGGIGLALVVVANAVWGSGLHLSALAAPLVLLPYLGVLYGLSLAFAALGVYVRDLGQITAALMTLALFTSTVLFPREMVPDALVHVVVLNPISWPVDTLRQAVLLGAWPDWSDLIGYSVVAWLAVAIGWRCFDRLRPGFADVL